MQKVGRDFIINYRLQPAKVETYDEKGETLFRVLFKDGREPLFLTQAVNRNRVIFWTSIPEGRQRMALEIGVLIERYFLLKNMN